MLGVRFCARAFSSCGKWRPLFIAVRGPLIIAASLVADTGSRRAGSVAVAHGPSCSAACGIFLDQGSNPCPLHWQADSQPLRHQGSPIIIIIIITIATVTRLSPSLLGRPSHTTSALPESPALRSCLCLLSVFRPRSSSSSSLPFPPCYPLLLQPSAG